VTGVLAVVYAFAPMDDAVHDGIPLLVGSLVALTALIIWHVRAVSRSGHPGVRAIEALATTVPFLLLSFAAVYFMLEDDSTDAFGVLLTRLDALYFSVTVFATVGFGDIAARSELARSLVTTQMIVDFLFLAVVVRVLVSAVQLGRSNLPEDRQQLPL
jgi:hypothetical protein